MKRIPEPLYGRGRVWLLGLALLACYAAQVRSGDWTGDFWEHSAVAAALIRNPWHPGHPTFAIDAPHATYSPYAVALALAGRLTGVGSMTLLAAAGAGNLILLLAGAWRLMGRAGLRRPGVVCFYSLLCWLFLWGHDAWQYSGFLHFGVLFQVLPYPSSFALGTTLWILSIRQPAESVRRLSGMGLLSALVLLTHPLTFIPLCMGLAGFGLVESRLWYTGWRLAAIPAIAVALGLCWPWYPLWRLAPGLSDGGAAYSLDGLPLYTAVMARTWPVWVSLPLLLTGGWSQRGRWALLLSAGLLAMVWGAGWIVGHEVFGRMIAYTVMLLHVVIAERLAWFESLARDGGRPARMRVLAGTVIVAVLLAGIAGSRVLIHHRLGVWWHAPEPLHRRVAADVDGLPRGTIVLADRYTAAKLPTYGMQTVCGRAPQPFVPDHAERVRAVESLFAGEADASQWETVRDRWNVTHILLNRERAAEPPEAILQAGRIVNEIDELVLIAWTNG